MLLKLLFCLTLYTIALSGTRPIISLYTHSLTGSEVIIGLVVGIYAFFPMVLAVFIGKWLDGIGSYRMTAYGGLGMLLALVIPTLIPTLPSLFFSQILMGFSQICVLISFQKTVGNLPGNRDQLMIWLSMTGSVGDLLGPLVNGFLYEHYGFQYSYGFSALLICIAVAVGLLMGKSSWRTGASSGGKQQKLTDLRSSFGMLRNIPLSKAIIAGGIVLYSKDLFVAYFPIYGIQIGLTPTFIGICLSVLAVASLLVRLMQMRLVETFGRSYVLMGTLILGGIVFVLVPFQSHEFVLLALAALLGMGLGLGQPLSLVYAMQISPREKQGEMLGLRLTFNRGAQFFSPMLFGLIGGAGGVISIFWASGMLLLFSSWATKLPVQQGDSSSHVPERKDVH